MREKKIKKRPTLKDVAILAGTSAMTVSRVINNRPGISEATRKRVQDAVLKLGYKPHPDARSLRIGITRRIGVIVSDIRNPFYSEVVAHIEDFARDDGFTIVVSDTSRRLDVEKITLEELIHVGVDFIIIAPEGFETSHLETYSKMVDMYSFGVHLPNIGLGEVWIDEEQGGRLAGEYLKSKGVKRAHLIMGNPHKFPTIGRIEGFRKGFGKIEDIDYIKVELKEGYKIGKNIKNLPDAFFCYNDFIASGLIKGLRERKIMVGEEVLVIGYDNTYLSEILGLTTIKIPIHSMISTLFKLIEEGKKEKIKFSPELIIRQTA